MNMNGNAGNNDVASDSGVGAADFKFETSGLKEGEVRAVVVGDAAVTVVADDLASAGGVQKGQTRRKVVRSSGGVAIGRKRWGKIARLPLEIRDWLNEQMRDGMKYVEISAALVQKGFCGVTKFDLSDWRRGGHQEWLQEQERIAALRNDVGRVVKAVESFSEKEEEGVERVNEMLIGLQVVHALQDLQRGTLKQLVEAKPELLFRIARVTSDQARDRARRKRVNLSVRKHNDRVAENKALHERENIPKSEMGLTPETLAKMEKELARIL